jgi:Rne/Rng family ribonuclease
MNKELFVSSTPHETKVGLMEDDQLAEVYLERENEYTLAGSIYKGRVTRVLPGMQSAFVDIGLERDAFLYVSDFMEVEEDDEVEEIPTSRQVISEPQAHAQPERSAPEQSAAPVAELPSVEEEEDFQTADAAEPGQPEARENGGDGEGQQQERDGRGGWRSRRRRRGRRGERFPNPKFTKTPSESRPPRTESSDLLPGESISKYQRFSQSQATSAAPQAPAPTEPEEAVSQSFPQDEPLFANSSSATEAPQPQSAPGTEELAEVEAQIASERDYEDERLDREDVAISAHQTSSLDSSETRPEPVESFQQNASHSGIMDEEEIDEEEADLASYVEELDEDAVFDEMEEETRAAEDYHQATEIAASGEPSAEAAELPHTDAFAAESAEQQEEVEEAADDEAELDLAQAEAEAALDAEARGNGTVDARAEVRAPAGTAAYTQRAPRPGFDRRGRPRRGGRRFRRREPQQVPQITDLLKEGQEVLIQIAKEPIGKKGARITSHIALPGRFLVYMPTVNHTGVSRKIASEEERQRLKRIILSERENGHGGFIVRTAAQGASEDELRADIRFLKGLWSEIRNRADNGKAPALIYHDLNVVERVLRDQVTSDFSAIWVDNEQEYERILRFANRFQPALVRRVKLYTKETPLFEQFGIKDEIDKALKSKVWLKSGGYIVINQTEALVAIDVNTGKYVGKTARLEDTIVKTNVDAIKEIVRQIRLRDLGGIIVIDFIDMDERRNRQKVMQALEEALRGDRAPSKVLQFNDFGLVAITRKRVKQSLERTIGSPCPYCTGTGFVKSVGTICNEIYVEMRKISRHLEHSDVLLRVNPEVAKMLKSNNGRALNEMEELTKRTIIVKSDPALHQEQFDIN